MRPYPDEILRSMQFSLDTYVIPNVDDKWGSYVAKVMRRMLIHLERRWEFEGPLLVEDIDDLRGLFATLGDQLSALDGPAAGDEAARLVELLGRALDDSDEPITGYVSVRELTERNEQLRETLVQVIEGLDGLEEVAADGELETPRHEIRSYLRRQTDRDKQLAEPTFMSFAPPSEQKGSKGQAA